MPWKRFGFALRDAACAELVTAFERYLASGSCSHPDAVGLVSAVGRGLVEGGREGAWNGKGNRWQDSARTRVPQRPALRNILSGPVGRHRGTRENQPPGTGQRGRCQHRGLVCVLEEIMSPLQLSPVPILALSITADIRDQEGAEHKTFQQTWETMLNLLLPGASIDLKTSCC